VPTTVPTTESVATDTVMRGAVLTAPNQPLQLRTVPMPTVGPGEVLVAVRAVGICATDLLTASGFFDAFGLHPYPRILGHEIVGVVSEVGQGVCGYAPGDRVGVHWILACGECTSCRQGHEPTCHRFLTEIRGVGLTTDGGYAQYVKVPHERLVGLPPQLDFATAAPLFCGGLTMYAALRNGGVQAGTRVGIAGIGGLGHLGIAIAAALGAEVVAVTGSDTKREWAHRLGAAHVVVGRGAAAAAGLREIGGVDVLLPTMPSAQPIRTLLGGLRPRGTIVLVGLSSAPLQVSPAALISMEARIVGSAIGSRRQLVELLELAVRGDIRAIVEVFDLADVNDAHERIRDDAIRFRAVLTP
jgi:D-arabinose 1-dehydrogenase-like Zn-dependent alcohol dehydrogenase